MFTKNEDDQKWRGITVDIDELIAANTTQLPPEKEVDELPDYIQQCLDENFKDSRFIIRESNIFYRNINKEVLFINKIINMKYYYDTKNKNFLLSRIYINF